MCEAKMDPANILRLMRQANAIKCYDFAIDMGNRLDGGMMDVLMMGEFDLPGGATTGMVKLRCHVDDFKEAAIMHLGETCPKKWPLIGADYNFAILLRDTKGDNFLHYRS